MNSVSLHVPRRPALTGFLTLWPTKGSRTNDTTVYLNVNQVKCIVNDFTLSDAPQRKASFFFLYLRLAIIFCGL
jgi:hypothetical protein